MKENILQNLGFHPLEKRILLTFGVLATAFSSFCSMTIKIITDRIESVAAKQKSRKWRVTSFKVIIFTI